MRITKQNRIAHVFYTRLEQKGEEKLTEADRTRCGRRLLRCALKADFGLTDPEDAECAKEEKGKPVLLHHPEICFNISHSGDYCILALAGRPVGIDIQEKRVTDVMHVGKRVLSLEEYRAFLASEDKQDAFFRQWVLKESYLKWTGEGLTVDLKSVPRGGWSQFLYIDKNYSCAIFADIPLAVQVEEVNINGYE